MKKTFWAICLFIGATAFAACSDKTTQENKNEADSVAAAPTVDYAAIVEKEIPSIETIDNLVLKFVEVTSNLGHPYGKKNLAHVKNVLQGFDVTDTKGEFFIKAVKNATVQRNEETYEFEGAVVNPDSLGVAIWILPMGDFYDLVTIAMFDDNIFAAQVKRLEAAGYTLEKPEEGMADDQGQTYKKKDGKCYWVVYPQKRKMEAHYDFQNCM